MDKMHDSWPDERTVYQWPATDDEDHGLLRVREADGVGFIEYSLDGEQWFSSPSDPTTWGGHDGEEEVIHLARTIAALQAENERLRAGIRQLQAARASYAQAYHSDDPAALDNAWDKVEERMERLYALAAEREEE